MPRGTPSEREASPRASNSMQRGPMQRGLDRPRRRLANTRRAARELLDQLLGRADRGLPR